PCQILRELGRDQDDDCEQHAQRGHRTEHEPDQQHRVGRRRGAEAEQQPLSIDACLEVAQRQTRRSQLTIDVFGGFDQTFVHCALDAHVRVRILYLIPSRGAKLTGTASITTSSRVGRPISSASTSMRRSAANRSRNASSDAKARSLTEERELSIPPEI